MVLKRSTYGPGYNRNHLPLPRNPPPPRNIIPNIPQPERRGGPTGELESIFKKKAPQRGGRETEKKDRGGLHVVLSRGALKRIIRPLARDYKISKN